MFKTIVLPVDLTNRHQPALDMAAEFAIASKGAISLVHVIETIAGSAADEDKEFYSRLEESARSHLDKLAAPLENQGIALKREIRYGSRASETVRFAWEADADLIIVSARAAEPTNPERAWTSLSYKIGMLSHCPVLLVK